MKFIKKLLPKEIYQIAVDFYLDKIIKYKNDSYSQEGEDLILKRLFENKKDGFYVDVGAHHPRRFSNTYSFYRIGWRGINIEARPGSKKQFDKVRKRDINIEAAISDISSELTYYFFDDPALNSFDKELSFDRAKNSKYKIIKKVTLKTIKLSEVLDLYLDPFQEIDFMSIDTEGYDLSVLKSNNWDKYIPKVILCEDSEFDFSSPSKSEIYNFLLERNYKLISKTINTLIFKNINKL